MRFFCVSFLVSLAGLFGGFECFGVAPSLAERHPVPDHAQVLAARQLVHDAFEADYLSSAGNPDPLIAKLITASGQTKDPVRAYALLLEAEHVAVSAGRVDRVMELVDIRARDFSINPIEARAAWLEQLFTPQARRESATLYSLFGHSIQTASRGLAEETFDLAESAGDLAASLAKAMFLLGKATKSSSLAGDGENKQRQAKELVQEIMTRRELFEGFEQGQSTLKNNPDDPIANETVGAYLCFCRGDWAAGLPLLAKGGDRSLGDLATGEQAVFAAEHVNANELFKLANGWWELTERRAYPERRAYTAEIMRHASTLYAKCLPGLTDPVDIAIASSRTSEADKPDDPSPEPLESPPLSVGRVCWGAKAGGVYFIRQATTRRWYLPSKVDKNWYRFEELGRKKDSVELVDKSRNMIVRLSPGKMEWTTGDKPGEWKLYLEGDWLDYDKAARTIEAFRPSARLLYFPFKGRQKADAVEAKRMLEWLGARDVIVHPGGGSVSGTLDPATEITVWPRTYNQDFVYGIRHGSPGNRSYFSSNDTYFELCRPE